MENDTPDQSAPQAEKSQNYSPIEHNRVNIHLNELIQRLETKNLQQKSAFNVEANKNRAAPLMIFQYEYHNPQYHRDVWTLAATDNSGWVLGIRTTLIEEEMKGILKAEGNIEVYKRGARVASALEAVNFILLQGQINAHPEISHLEYVIDDANLRRIQNAKSGLDIATRKNDQEKVTSISAQLQQLNDQRAAWLRLYGAEGKLGFTQIDHRLKKIFTRQHPNTQGLEDFTITPSDEKYDLLANLKALAT